MEKLTLKDSTELNILDGATTNIMQIVISAVSDFENVYNALTDDNLAEVSISTSGGEICSKLKNKTLTSATVETVTIDEADMLVITIVLRDISTIEQRLTTVETTQELQDEAITELAMMATEQEKTLVNFYVYRIKKDKLKLEEVPDKWLAEVKAVLDSESE